MSFTWRSYPSSILGCVESFVVFPCRHVRLCTWLCPCVYALDNVLCSQTTRSRPLNCLILLKLVFFHCITAMIRPSIVLSTAETYCDFSTSQIRFVRSIVSGVVRGVGHWAMPPSPPTQIRKLGDKLSFGTPHSGKTRFFHKILK